MRSGGQRPNEGSFATVSVRGEYLGPECLESRRKFRELALVGMGQRTGADIRVPTQSCSGRRDRHPERRTDRVAADQWYPIVLVGDPLAVVLPSTLLSP